MSRSLAAVSPMYLVITPSSRITKSGRWSSPAIDTGRERLSRPRWADQQQRSQWLEPVLSEPVGLSLLGENWLDSGADWVSTTRSLNRLSGYETCKQPSQVPAVVELPVSDELLSPA